MALAELPLICTLRQRRADAGLSQAQLAGQVGVSRQALGAIEAGRQVPSTTLALQLARALRCELDDLFRLAGGRVVHARLAAAVAAGQRVVVGRVAGAWVAHPLLDATHAADGLVLERPGADGLAAVELCGELGEVERNLLVAGCAPLLGVLSERLARRHRGARASWIPANSTESLALLERGLVHVAGMHLARADEPELHLRAARRALAGQRATLVNLARWRQGLIVAPGNPLSLSLGAQLLRPKLRYVTRDAGAGAQRLLEGVLREVAGEGSTPEVHSVARASGHAEVAQLVRWGVADLGVAIESVALAAGLDFIPLAEERFDLVVAASVLESPAAARFVDLIDRPSFRAEVARLPGYDLSHAGELASVAP